MEYLERGTEENNLSDLISYVSQKLEATDRFYSASTPTDFRLVGTDLTFTSPLAGTPRANNRVIARLYRARKSDRAIVLLPHWNAKREALSTFCTLLARFGITCLHLSLPYHDERQTPDHGFAHELVSENIGQTIQANRQAVLDGRACLDWLEREGYSSLGVVGISLGSSIAAIISAHDERVKAAALLLMADDFTDVVWTSSATVHVRSGLERDFSRTDIGKAWTIISPNRFADRLSARLKDILIISGTRDAVFVPALTRQYVERLLCLGARPIWRRYPCGHYTLSMMPFNILTFANLYIHLKRRL